MAATLKNEDFCIIKLPRRMQITRVGVLITCTPSGSMCVDNVDFVRTVSYSAKKNKPVHKVCKNDMNPAF